MTAMGVARRKFTTKAGLSYDLSLGKQADSYRNNSGTAYGHNLVGNNYPLISDILLPKKTLISEAPPSTASETKCA